MECISDLLNDNFLNRMADFWRAAEFTQHSIGTKSLNVTDFRSASSPLCLWEWVSWCDAHAASQHACWRAAGGFYTETQINKHLSAPLVGSRASGRCGVACGTWDIHQIRLGCREDGSNVHPPSFWNFVNRPSLLYDWKHCGRRGCNKLERNRSFLFCFGWWLDAQIAQHRRVQCLSV